MMYSRLSLTCTVVVYIILQVLRFPHFLQTLHAAQMSKLQILGKNFTCTITGKAYIWTLNMKMFHDICA